MKYIKTYETMFEGFKPQQIDVSWESNPDGITDEFIYSMMKKKLKDVMFLNTMNSPIYRSNDKRQIEYRDRAIADGFKVITFPNSEGGEVFIVHANNSRAKKKAEALAKIAKSRGGFLNDQTPKEAREIGRLLDYRESDIDEYINRRYK